MTNDEHMSSQSINDTYGMATHISAVIEDKELDIEYILTKNLYGDRLCITILDTTYQRKFKETFEYYELNPNKANNSLMWLKILIDQHVQSGNIEFVEIDYDNLDLKNKFYRKPIIQCGTPDCAALVWLIHYGKSQFNLQIPKLL